MSLISDRPIEGQSFGFEPLDPGLRRVLDALPDAVVVTHASGRIVYANARAHGLFRYRDGGLADKTVDALVPLRFRNAASKECALWLRPGAAAGTPVELCGLRGDATEFAIEVTSGELDSREGRVVISTIRDIAQRKRAEQALERTAELTTDELHESERRFTTMLANVDLIAVMLDHDARVTYCNDYLLRLTGWDLEQVRGRDFIELFVRDGAGELRELFGTLLQDAASSWHHENEIFTRSGESRLIQWNNTVLRSPSGSVVGTASIGKDITLRKRAEEEVRRLAGDLERRVGERTAELEAANRELEAFDYSISHDLRAPVSRIEGFAAALLDEHGATLAPEAADYGRRIHGAAVQMNQLIDDLLELSLATRGELERRDVDVSRLASVVLDALRKADPARAVEAAVAPGLHARADPGLLRIVLQNLLENAWKFTSNRPGARIEFGARDIGGHRTFVVKDNGAGFDALQATRVFDAFRRQHEQTEFRGTGIGLATVQRIVRRHGGRVWAESAVGAGATFYFTLAP